MRNKIIEIARSWEGVPWAHQGRTRSGCDCAGLVIHVFSELQGTPNLPANYGRVPDGVMLKALLDKHLIRKRKEPEPGDVLLMRIKRDPQHLAIKTDYGIIHSHERAGKIVETVMSENWRKRIVAVYEFPGVK